MTKLDEKTTVPLFSALIGLVVLVGGLAWLFSIDAKADRAIAQNITAKELAKDLADEVKEVKKSLQRIEIKLGTYPNNKGE